MIRQGATTAKRFRPVILALMILGMAGLIAGTFALYGSVSAGSSGLISDTVMVMDLDDHGGVGVMNPQTRGTSDLVRSADGISMNIDTTDLPVGVATIWWAIFNNPSECSDGQCHHLMDTGRGGAPNLAEGTVLWATSGIAGPDRIGHFSASLGVGLENAPGQVLRGPGLTNPMGAEVHWIIKYHGPTMWDDLEMLSLQMTNVKGNCDNFPCYDPQRAIHKP